MSYAAIGYALLGHYLRQYHGTVRRGWYGAALAAGLAVTFIGTAALTLQKGALAQNFLEGMSPGPMLMALGWFGLVRAGFGPQRAAKGADGGDRPLGAGVLLHLPLPHPLPEMVPPPRAQPAFHVERPVHPAGGPAASGLRMATLGGAAPTAGDM